MYRFALSPTKDLQTEELRVALYSFISAKKSDKKFIIQIEDSNHEKNIQGKDREILEILNLFGITYDSVHYQSNNLKFHRQLASKLLMDSNAFSCFCTEEIIETKKEQAKQNATTYSYDGTCKKLTNDEVMANETPFVIRAKKPDDKKIDDFMILRVDKTATSNFANAIDDMLNSVTTIIEDEKKWLDFQKQELIRNYLSYNEKIELIKLPTMLNSFSVKSLLEDGFMPASILNYLLLLENKTEKEIFTLDEAFEFVDVNNLTKEEVKFDIDKLKDINKKHIKLLPQLQLAKLIGYSSKDIGELAKVYLEEASTINEIKAKIDTIFSKDKSNEFSEDIKKLKDISKNLPYFKEYDEFKDTLLKESPLDEQLFDKHLRVLLTGAESGPSLDKIYPHIKNYLGEIIR